jgi:hypothetical protein
MARQYMSSGWNRKLCRWAFLSLDIPLFVTNDSDAANFFQSPGFLLRFGRITQF